MIFHPEEDDGDLVDSSSSSSIRDEERKEEESLEDGVLMNGLEQAQVQDQDAYQSPER